MGYKRNLFYKYAPPVVLFAATAAAVFIWNYSINVFEDQYAGFMSAGRIAEVYAAFFKEPAILLTTLGIALFIIGSFAAVIRAAHERRRGAALLLLLPPAAAAVYATIVITAVNQIAS